jgi:hypothetical protein
MYGRLPDFWSRIIDPLESSFKMSSDRDKAEINAGIANEIEDTTLRQLISEDQGEILDRIDELRGTGLQLPLPQIIVCGDQSSGKSSVLEAISRLSFPIGKGCCTTFPTELVLRRGPAWGPIVKIKPAASRSKAEKQRLSRPLSTTAEDFESVVKEAKGLLQGPSDAEDSYHEDILHIEVHNPSWPPLTLVDLPGIIHSKSKRQTEEDVDKVKSLVRSYMERPNTVILAVISARYDPEIQEVLNMAGEVDPDGKRTLGIITNPDVIHRDHEEELKFIRYANNEEHRFELGWHVVKNLSSENRHRDLTERDREEQTFFSQGIWHNALKTPTQLGIGPLRIRLSSILKDITRPALPGILAKLRESLDSCKTELRWLGEPRESRQEQLEYITNISYNFHRILEQAVRGDYFDTTFFKPGLEETDSRRLRAAIRNLNDDFAEVMYQYGHKHYFGNYSEDLFEGEREEGEEVDEEEKEEEFISRYSITKYQGLSVPTEPWRSTYLEEVTRLAAQNKGTELPGMPKPYLIGELFRQQSEPWSRIASAHIETVWEVACNTLRLIASHVSPPETADALRFHIIEDKMQDKRDILIAKLQELMKPFQRYHPITHSRDFFDKVKNIKRSRSSMSTPAISDAFLSTDERAADIAVGYMLAYYEVRSILKTFTHKANDYL